MESKTNGGGDHWVSGIGRIMAREWWTMGERGEGEGEGERMKKGLMTAQSNGQLFQGNPSVVHEKSRL
jgi:hypothetical protein